MPRRIGVGLPALDVPDALHVAASANTPAAKRPAAVATVTAKVSSTAARIRQIERPLLSGAARWPQWAQ